jgi:hypothetical protein
MGNVKAKCPVRKYRMGKRVDVKDEENMSEDPGNGKCKALSSAHIAF